MDLELSDPKLPKPDPQFKGMCHPKIFVFLLSAAQLFLALYCLIAIAEKSLLVSFPLPSFDAQPLFGPDYVINNGTSSKVSNNHKAKKNDPSRMTYLLQAKRYILFAAAWMFITAAILSNIAIRMQRSKVAQKFLSLFLLTPTIIVTFLCFQPLAVLYVRIWRKFVYEQCISTKGCDDWIFYTELFAFVVIPGCVFLAAYLYIIYGLYCTLIYVASKKANENLVFPALKRTATTVSRSWSKRTAAAEVNRELKSALDVSRINSNSDSPGSSDDRHFVNVKQHMSMTELTALNSSGTMSRGLYDYREPSSSRYQQPFLPQSLTLGMSSPYPTRQHSLREYRRPMLQRPGYGYSAALGLPFPSEDTYSQL